METKQKELKTFKTVYVAVDGTEFDNDKECRIYERSASGVLRGMVHKLAVREMTEEEAFSTGSCDNDCWIVIPKTKEDIFHLKQLFLSSGGSQSYAEKLDDSQIGRIVIVTFSYDDSSMWFKTLDSLVEGIAGDSVTLTYVEDKQQQ